MQLSPGNRKTFQEKFEKLNPAAKEILMGSAVSLNAPGFQGSGVLFMINDGATMAYILTAKHNLRLGKPLVPKQTPAPSRMVDAFTKAVTVRYGAVNFKDRPTSTGSLEHGPNNGGNNFIFGNASQDNWAYDVMMVQSSDAGLINHAKKFAPVKNFEALNGLISTLSEPGLALKRTAKRTFWQIGFGYSDDKSKTGDKVLGLFQARETQPSAQAVADMAYNYDSTQKYEALNLHVVMLTADNTNSTAPGDSGGPLFCVEIPDKGAPVVNPLGVTAGSNMSLTSGVQLGDDPIVVNVSAYLKMWICLALPFPDVCD
jgi:hypothetical protein